MSKKRLTNIFFSFFWFSNSLLLSMNPSPVFMKIIGHFRWLGPNVWWEISQIWIGSIKAIRQMSDESWKFFGYTASPKPKGHMHDLSRSGLRDVRVMVQNFHFKTHKNSLECCRGKWLGANRQQAVTWANVHWYAYPLYIDWQAYYLIQSSNIDINIILT